MTKLIVRMQEGDDVVNKSCERLEKATGAKTIKLAEIAKVGKLVKGDTLILLGHGNTSALSKKSAEQIADILAKADLKSGITVDLVACNSGTGGSPLALAVKTQLVSHKIVPASVSGGQGYMRVLSDGSGGIGVRTKTGQVDKKGRAIKSEVRAGTVKEQTPWGERTRNVNPEYRTGPGN
jgi:hypothetical protein